MSKPYPQAGEVKSWTNERGVLCVRLGVPGQGDKVRIHQNGKRGADVSVDMIDAVCEALQAAKAKIEDERAQVEQLRLRQQRHRMEELKPKAELWIHSHGTRRYDDMVADVMTEHGLSEDDADLLLTLVEECAQVFVEFDLSDLFGAAAE